MDEIVPISKSKACSSNHSSLVELGPSLASQLNEISGISMVFPPETEERNKHARALKIQCAWYRFKALAIFKRM